MGCCVMWWCSYAQLNMMHNINKHRYKFMSKKLFKVYVQIKNYFFKIIYDKLYTTNHKEKITTKKMKWRKKNIKQKKQKNKESRGKKNQMKGMFTRESFTSIQIVNFWFLTCKRKGGGFYKLLQQRATQGIVTSSKRNNNKFKKNWHGEHIDNFYNNPTLWQFNFRIKIHIVTSRCHRSLMKSLRMNKKNRYTYSLFSSKTWTSLFQFHVILLKSTQDYHKYVTFGFESHAIMWNQFHH
jgi:hypothetical protein